MGVKISLWESDFNYFEYIPRSGLLNHMGVLVLIFLFKDLKKIMFRKGGKEEEKHQPVASCTPPTGDLAHNPGVCTGGESHQWPFRSAEQHPTHWATPVRALVFMFLKTLYNVFLEVAPFYISIYSIQVFQFLHILTNTDLLGFLKNNIYTNRCEVISICGFGLYLSDESWCWAPVHIPGGHLYVFFGKMSILFLGLFKKTELIGGFVVVTLFCLYYWILWVPCIFWVLAPPQINGLQISLPFHPVDRFLHCAEDFMLWSWCAPTCLLCWLRFWCHCQDQCQDFLLFFFLGVYGFNSNVLVFSPPWVGFCGWCKIGLHFILLRVGIWFSHTGWLCLFPIVYCWHPFEDQLTVSAWVYFWLSIPFCWSTRLP